MNLYVLIIALSALVVQVGFIAFFLFVFRRQRHQPAAPYGPPVSVVICAHDEEHNLRELLPLLLKQDYPIYEIIVVEDRCNDGTYDYLLGMTKEHPMLKMVRVQHLPDHLNGKKYALTLGIKGARHDWVLLTDADCRPAGTGWIREMMAARESGHSFILGYSPYVRQTGLLNAFIRFEALVTAIQYLGWALAGKPYMGTGRNLAYTRQVFLDNKGFHQHLGVTGGDDDLFVNAHANGGNTAVAWGKDTLMYSVPKTTWKAFLVQKLRHLSAGKHYRWSNRFVLGIFALSWLMSWFMAVPLLFSIDYLYVLGGAWVIRQALLLTLVYRASHMLGEPFEAWKTPFLDFIYAIYYLGTGLSALMSKRVRWKI